MGINLYRLDDKYNFISIIFTSEQESKTLRIHDIHTLVHQLPEPNFRMLEMLIGHLRR